MQVESMLSSLAAVGALGQLPPGLGSFPPAAYLNPWYQNTHQRPSTTPDR